jgi:hypothetical protein
MVKMLLHDRLMLLMHLLTSIMEYLLVWVLAFRAQKSCTNLMPLFFLAIAKIGLLNLLQADWMIPSFNHSAMCLSTFSKCVLGILNYLM